MPEPWSPTIEELTDEGVRGVVYAHELVTVPVGTVRTFLDALAEAGVPALEPLELRCVGALPRRDDQRHRGRRALGDPDVGGVVGFEQAWDGPDLAAWRARLTAMGADVRRTLMVDAPLSPMRTGRQPQIEDRRPLDEL